jgi:hypothetical protein
MIVTTSWDDGDPLDDRVADLLDRHGLRGTFYIPRAHRPRQISKEGIRALAKRHEVAAHSLSHPDLTMLSRVAKRHEIEGSKKWLEDLTGAAVRMFCYPFGRFDAETKSVVAASGFAGARTTRQFVLAPHTDPFALATTLQVYPAPVRRRSLRDFASYLVAPALGPGERHGHLRVLNSAFLGWCGFAAALCMSTAPGLDSVFHLWGHSWEIDQFGMWNELDIFLAQLGSLASRAETNGGILSVAPLCSSVMVPVRPETGHDDSCR